MQSVAAGILAPRLKRHFTAGVTTLGFEMMSVCVDDTAAILIPNIAAAIFNLYYNHAAIIASHPSMQTGFFKLASVVNAVAFPIGAAAMVVTAFPVARSIKRLQRRVRTQPKDLNRLMELRRRAAWIGFALWMIAVLIYPR